jgi:aryl-alcohol dehydrogenase-like predicted oxidoreductase
VERARRLVTLLPSGPRLDELAVRFALSNQGVTSAIIGLGSPEEVRRAVSYAAKGPLDTALLATLESAALQSAQARR